MAVRPNRSLGTETADLQRFSSSARHSPLQEFLNREGATWCQGVFEVKTFSIRSIGRYCSAVLDHSRATAAIVECLFMRSRALRRVSVRSIRVCVEAWLMGAMLAVALAQVAKPAAGPSAKSPAKSLDSPIATSIATPIATPVALPG